MDLQPQSNPPLVVSPKGALLHSKEREAVRTVLLSHYAD